MSNAVSMNIPTDHPLADWILNQANRSSRVTLTVENVTASLLFTGNVGIGYVYDDDVIYPQKTHQRGAYLETEWRLV